MSLLDLEKRINPKQVLREHNKLTEEAVERVEAVLLRSLRLTEVYAKRLTRGRVAANLILDFKLPLRSQLEGAVREAFVASYQAGVLDVAREMGKENPKMPSGSTTFIIIKSRLYAETMADQIETRIKEKWAGLLEMRNGMSEAAAYEARLVYTSFLGIRPEG